MSLDLAGEPAQHCDLNVARLLQPTVPTAKGKHSLLQMLLIQKSAHNPQMPVIGSNQPYPPVWFVFCFPTSAHEPQQVSSSHRILPFWH